MGVSILPYQKYNNKKQKGDVMFSEDMLCVNVKKDKYGVRLIIGYGDVEVADAVKECKEIGTVSNVEEYHDEFTDEVDVTVEIMNDTQMGMEIRSQNCITSSNAYEQELATYRRIKESFEAGDYNNARILIVNYLGHIDYGKEFGYCKTHGEIVDIMLTQLIYHIQYGGPINFVEKQIARLEKCVENGGWW